MMKLFVLGLVTLPAMTTAQTTPASTKPDPVMVTDIPPPHGPSRRGEPALDPVNFCYFDGKAYSKGAVYAGQVCSAGMVTYAATPNRPASTLSWMPASKR